MTEEEVWSDSGSEGGSPAEAAAVQNGGSGDAGGPGERLVSCVLRVPFPTERTAVVALSSLQVDKEPPRSNVRRQLSVCGSDLVANFEGPELKKLRTSMNSFVDHVDLVRRTIGEFDLLQ